MATNRIPGVFIREMQFGPRPIVSDSTAIAGFVGFTEKAPADDPNDPDGVNPRRVRSWPEFEGRYGGFAPGSMLPPAVHGYFANGGREAYIARIPNGATSADSFIGSTAAVQGIVALDTVDELTMLVAPDLVTTARLADGTTDHTIWQAVQRAMIASCEKRRDRMAILDAPPGLSPTEVASWRRGAAYDSAFAGLYYPWIDVAGPAPVSRASRSSIPPSGHVAGVYASTDITRGVWKAPANVVVVGALDLAVAVDDSDLEVLNPLGINAFRRLSSGEIKIWGARTLSSDPSWTFVGVRRLVTMVHQSILKAMKRLTFEPNDDANWGALVQSIENFLTNLWREGAFQGRQAGDAFFVRSSRGSDSRSVQVGVAPLRPAEFITLEIEAPPNLM